MAVGEMQEVRIAEAGPVIETGPLGANRPERQSGRRGHGKDVKELAAIQARSRYLFTGEFGSRSSAVRSLICCSVRIALWPKRGMLEHAE